MKDDYEFSGSEMSFSFTGTVTKGDMKALVSASACRKDDMGVYLKVSVSIDEWDHCVSAHSDMRCGVHALGALIVLGNMIEERIGELT